MAGLVFISFLFLQLGDLILTSGYDSSEGRLCPCDASRRFLRLEMKVAAAWPRVGHPPHPPTDPQMSLSLTLSKRRRKKKPPCLKLLPCQKVKVQFAVGESGFLCPHMKSKLAVFFFFLLAGLFVFWQKYPPTHPRYLFIRYLVRRYIMHEATTMLNYTCMIQIPHSNEAVWYSLDSREETWYTFFFFSRFGTEDLL